MCKKTIVDDSNSGRGVVRDAGTIESVQQWTNKVVVCTKVGLLSFSDTSNMQLGLYKVAIGSHEGVAEGGVPGADVHVAGVRTGERCVPGSSSQDISSVADGGVSTVSCAGTLQGFAGENMPALRQGSAHVFVDEAHRGGM